MNRQLRVHYCIFFWWCRMMGSNSESATGRLTMGHVFFSFSYHINSVFIQWITVNTRTKQVYWDCLQIIFQLYSMGIMPLHVRALMINQPEWRFTWWYQFYSSLDDLRWVNINQRGRDGRQLSRKRLLGDKNTSLGRPWRLRRISEIVFRSLP